MYPLLFSVTTTQVDVPSTCTTKDVPSNVLRQSSQTVSPLKLCERGNKRILRRLGRIKRILRLCHFEFFDKGEGRHKRIQAVSPSLFWKRLKRDTKRIQAQRSIRDVPSLVLFEQEMYPLLFSVTTIQVDVPSTCTTKDVPSNVLRQSSQAVSPLKLCEGGNKRILRGVKGETKEFMRLVLRSFGKGRRETQKEFRRLVLGKFFLAKGEENEKMNSISF
ncbi:hypothetical protein HKD37_06G017012 [Glycine soja]